MTVSATSSPVVLLSNAVEPAKAVASVTANPSGDAVAGEFQQMLAQAAEGGRATAGLTLLTGPAAQGNIGEQDPVGEDGNSLPLLTGLLPPAPIMPASAGSDAKLEGDSAEHKNSDDEQTDQALTLLVTPPALPPAPVVPANTASANTVSTAAQTAAGEAQAAALNTAQPAAELLSAQLFAGGSGVVEKGAVKGEAQSAIPGTAKAATKATAAISGDALAIAATTTTASTTTSAVAATDLATLNPVGASASAKGDGNNADFAGLLKQLDASSAAQPTGSIDSGRTVQQADRVYQQQTTPATATVSLPMTSDGWPDAVADKVMWFSANKITSAEIHLNPPDLGPIQVRISTENDKASVYFTSQHASVREALDQALPRLRDMMGGQGIQLANAGVGGQGSSPQQQDYRGNSDGRSRSADGFLRERDDGAEPIGVSSVSTARLARSGIDAYA